MKNYKRQLEMTLCLEMQDYNSHLISNNNMIIDMIKGENSLEEMSWDDYIFELHNLYATIIHKYKKEVKMKGKINKKEMKEFMTNLIDGFDKEYLDNPIYLHLIEQSDKVDFEDTEDVFYKIVYPFDRCLDLATRRNLGIGRDLSDIFKYFQILKRNTTELCSKFYGSPCCADRGRHLVGAYFKYKRSGTMPEFNWEGEYIFHYPHSGSYEQWFNLIEGVLSFIYGNPTKYLEALVELKEAPMHKEPIKRQKEYELKNLKKELLKGGKNKKC